jgi:hypothetical protein
MEVVTECIVVPFLNVLIDRASELKLNIFVWAYIEI